MTVVVYRILYSNIDFCHITAVSMQTWGAALGKTYL